MSGENVQEVAASLVDAWGGTSRILCGLGGLVAIGGGLSLVLLKAASENSMIETIGNGMGWYFIGKGLFMIATPFQIRAAVTRLISK